MFSCELCPYGGSKKGDIAADSHCLQQFLKLMPFFSDFFPCQFWTKYQIISIPTASMKILKEYSSILSEYKKRIQSLIRHIPDIKLQLYSNPLVAYETLKSAYRFSKKHSIQQVLNALEHTTLITKSKTGKSNQQVEKDILLENLLKIRRTRRVEKDSKNSEIVHQTLSSHVLGPFKIEILDFPNDPFEKQYRAVLALNDVLSPRILQHLYSKQVTNTIDFRLQTLDEVIHNQMTDFRHYLSSNFPELTDNEQTKFAIYATAQSLNLTKTMPLLLDDEVQEIYLDKPGTTYYLDHSRWGRCRSNLSPSPSELAHIITRLRLESRRPLDEKTPSLKTELKTSLFHVRAAIDIPPLAYNGPHLNIRKIRMRTFTLPELILNRTISLAAAAFLVTCMSLRINITISGEPSTGKTTLANAINMVAPPSWRRIAIEDALESVTVNEEGRHKVTFKVDPFDSSGTSRTTKSTEIIRLLHRSPDWVFLGELQTSEHSEAMFHALSAGIKGIQTCHANSNSELLLRWRIHHKIPEVCFKSLGLLINMVKDNFKGQIVRRVAQISEVHYEDEEACLQNLFEWNKTTGKLEHTSSSMISPLITRSCQFQQLSKSAVLRRYRIYEETLNQLVLRKQLKPDVIVEKFDNAHASVFPGGVEISSFPKKKKREDEVIELHTSTS